MDTERKLDYGEEVDVDNLFVEGGNVLAELSPNASPDYGTVLEECLPRLKGPTSATLPGVT